MTRYWYIELGHGVGYGVESHYSYTHEVSTIPPELLVIKNYKLQEEYKAKHPHMPLKHKEFWVNYAREITFEEMEEFLDREKA